MSNKIKELATKMILASGLRVKNAENPNGDIEIINTGLRPGEKLYEELLVDGKALSTIHPRIFKSSEKSISYDKIWEDIDILEKSLKKYDLNNSLLFLKKIVKDWEQN